MTGRPTDHANIDLHQLNLDVAFRRAGGKIIWQPRIGAWLTEKQFQHQPLPDWAEGKCDNEILRAMGISARLYDFNGCFVSQEDPAVKHHQRQLNEWDTEVVSETPAGEQTVVHHRSPNTWAGWPIKWPIACEEDMKVAIWREEHKTWSFNQQLYDELLAKWGDLGAPTMYMPRVNVQSLYIDSMGTEQAILAIYDYPDTCEAYFRALDESHDLLIQVLADSPVQLINFGDNVHSGTLPPPLFTKYVLPAYQRRCERLHAAGKFVHAHWDGDCRPLLPYVHETGLDGIEAVTPTPQGDVTLEETAEALGDMFLIDGLPAVYFDHTFDEQVLIDCTRKIIDLFAPNLILGISDEISTYGDIDRVNTVTRIVDDYNASV